VTPLRQMILLGLQSLTRGTPLTREQILFVITLLARAPSEIPGPGAVEEALESLETSKLVSHNPQGYQLTSLGRFSASILSARNQSRGQL